jgi:S-adenosylmethionine:tRNA ribosyltransferase-isomerase
VNPARWPRPSPLDDGLMVVDPAADRFEVRRVRDLVTFLDPGDLLVLNDSATLPGSLRGVTVTGVPIEARLLASRDGSWRAVLFGAGDWRTRTEDRPRPPPVRTGDVLVFPGGLDARVDGVSSVSERLVDLRFTATGDRFWSALYRYGRPVQYAYIAAPLPLWHVQTPFASRPWSSEMPSAARPLGWEIVLALRAKGVRFASLTHAAGLSSAGDARLDAAMPLRESFEVPGATAAAVNATRRSGGRVVAVGTSVVRALESAAAKSDGPLAGTSGETELLVDGTHTLRAVDALFTGMHDPGTSHDCLLHAFAPEGLLRRAHAEATARGFLGHELGDSMLIADLLDPRRHPEKAAAPCFSTTPTSTGRSRASASRASAGG